MGSVILPGNYDGVHRGHQHLIKIAQQKAQASGSVKVLTFSPPPSHFFGNAAPKRIMNDLQKIACLKAFGVNEVVVKTFDRAFASMSPEMFLQKIIKDELNADVIVIGENFRFGAGQAGDTRTLKTWCEHNGLVCEIVPAVAVEGQQISSSAIRAAVHAGRLDEARVMMGHPLELWAVVTSGDGRGRTLGVPTANLSVDPSQLLPPKGVYAVHVQSADTVHKGVANLGDRPTFSAGFSVEVHLIDFSGDLLGQMLRVRWIKHLRDEIRFDSTQTLVRQIRDDIERARAVL